MAAVGTSSTFLRRQHELGDAWSLHCKTQCLKHLRKRYVM